MLLFTKIIYSISDIIKEYKYKLESISNGLKMNDAKNICMLDHWDDKYSCRIVDNYTANIADAYFIGKILSQDHLRHYLQLFFKAHNYYVVKQTS